MFDVFKKFEYRDKVLERIEIFSSIDLLEYLGGFTIPNDICAFESDADLNIYDQDIPISKRVSIIPQPPPYQKDLFLKNKSIRPDRTPLRLNILANILPRRNPKIIEVRGKFRNSPVGTPSCYTVGKNRIPS